ncbi:MAG TPA: GNAT family N-acetyltransferase [Allosphingosinicella sp.]
MRLRGELHGLRYDRPPGQSGGFAAWAGMLQRLWPDCEAAELEVEPEWRRRGIAGALLSAVESWVRAKV